MSLCSQANSFVQEIRGTGSGRCRDNQGFRKNRRRLQFGHIAQVVSRPKAIATINARTDVKSRATIGGSALGRSSSMMNFSNYLLSGLETRRSEAARSLRAGEVRKKSAIPRHATMNAPKVKKVRITSRAILFAINPSL